MAKVEDLERSSMNIQLKLFKQFVSLFNRVNYLLKMIIKSTTLTLFTAMLHNQVLYDRRINVRMDKSNERPDGPLKLPEGLKGVGMGLGANGAPLTDVARQYLYNILNTGLRKREFIDVLYL